MPRFCLGPGPFTGSEPCSLQEDPTPLQLPYESRVGPDSQGDASARSGSPFEYLVFRLSRVQISLVSSIFSTQQPLVCLSPCRSPKRHVRASSRRLPSTQGRRMVPCPLHRDCALGKGLFWKAVVCRVVTMKVIIKCKSSVRLLISL